MHFSQTTKPKEKWHVLPPRLLFSSDWTGPHAGAETTADARTTTGGSKPARGQRNSWINPGGGSETDGGLRLDPAVGGWAPNPESPPHPLPNWKPPKNRFFLPLRSDEENVKRPRTRPAVLHRRQPALCAQGRWEHPQHGGQSPLQTRAWGGFTHFNGRDVSSSSESGPQRHRDTLEPSPSLQSCALPRPNPMKSSSCEKEYFWSVALGHGVHPSLQRF